MKRRQENGCGVPQAIVLGVILFVFTFLPVAYADPISVEPESGIVGEGITLHVDTTLVAEVSISDGTDRYRFMGEPEPTIQFVPRRAGTYDAEAVLTDGTTSTVTFVVIQSPETAAVTLPVEPVITEPTPIIDGLGPDLAAIVGGPPDVRGIPGDGFATATDGAPRAGILTSDGRVVNARMRWKGGDGTVVDTSSLETTPLQHGNYDLALSMRGRSLREITLRGLAYRGSLNLGIEELDPTTIRGGLSTAVDTFAIDPEQVEFIDGTVTFVAVGNALYKCVEYSFLERSCTGEHVKILDTIPGATYTIAISGVDPLFTQTGYLTNANFDTNTSGWTTLNEGANAATFTWSGLDSPQNGTADMTISGSNRAGIGNYYQPFNLTIPSGTSIVQINFSVLWRIPVYNSQAGSVNFTIQNAARTASLCSVTNAFSSTTSWRQENLTTGVGGCALGSFSANTNYTFRLRCVINTGPGGGSQEVCRWDNASIIVTYNDTTAPVLRNAADTPDPVEAGDRINISVNVTDNIQLDTVIIQINGTNATANVGPGDIRYNDTFSTARAPGVYYYRFYANDTNGNLASNTSSSLNFTIQDTKLPSIFLEGPPDDTVTSASSFLALYNVTDIVAISSCNITVNQTNRNFSSSITMHTPLSITATLLTDGPHLWNITCNDTSNNRNTSATRLITRDTITPQAILNTPNTTITANPAVSFGYTPFDTNIANCTLWGNFSGSWAANQTDTGVVSGTPDAFSAITLAHGAYRWNVLCTDRAGNSGFNQTNFTFIVDTVAPAFSNVIVAPASGAVYASGATYEFNATWVDNGTAVQTVLFETNTSGVLANITPIQVGSVYRVTLTDLAAGSYAYRWSANDSAGNTNRTTQSTYTIEPATVVFNLTLNDTQQNLTVGLGDVVNVTARLLLPSAGYVELYRNGVLVASGSAPVTNISLFIVEQRYNFTVRYPATQNFTTTQYSLFVDVLDTTPPSVSLDEPANGSLTLDTVTFFFTPVDNIDIGNCTIVLDGVLNATKDVGSATQANITITGIPEGLHNWTVNCSDTTNNSAINTTRRWFSVDTSAPSAFSLFSPVSGTVSVNTSPTFIWNATSDANFDRYTILVDNDAGFGSVNYQQNLTPVTNRSTVFALLDQVVWYWRVIAYDLPGNSVTSTQTYNYTTDATAPIITPTTPAANAYVNTTIVTLSYTVSDISLVPNCTLRINGLVNQTNTTITESNSFTTTLSEGVWNWSVACADIAGNADTTANRTLTVDITAPAAFNALEPAEGTFTSDNTPTYAWEPTVESAFFQYVVQVSDDELFPYANYTFTTTNTVDNTSVTQSPELPDGRWYWRAIAYDLAGNTYAAHPGFDVDTTPPSAFDLSTPANNTQTRNDTPTFTWQQSTDANFKNYTLLVSDSPTFTHVNYTNSTNTSAATSATLAVGQNITLYWRVIAYDLAGNSRNSTNTHLYLADFTNPNVTQVSPVDGATISTTSLVQFQYNVTDVGDIVNCSLYINGTLEKTVVAPTKSMTQTLATNLENGDYAWLVSCTDVALNTGNSTARVVSVNVSVPSQLLLETNTANLVATGYIGLSYANDATENQVSFSVASGASVTAVNATLALNGSGMLIYNQTIVNFSGVFSQSNNNVFFVTWRLWHVNATAATILCQYGDGAGGGVAVGNTAKKTLNGNCTYVGGDRVMRAGDNITLEVRMYNSAGTTRTFTHFWDDVSVSGTRFNGYKLGTLFVNMTNLTDPQVTEGQSYLEQCAVSCFDGTCLATDVYLELWNGTVWKNVTSVGNITLNNSQANPRSFGNLNISTTANFSLYSELYSYNNTLRCNGQSTYSTNVSQSKNVSVIDRTPPTVSLSSPEDNAAYDPQNITFTYTPSDLRLANCTLWGNWSGSWTVNFTNSTPSNAVTNSFPPVYLSYGIYTWNVQCVDNASNSAFAVTNRTLYIAGDLEIVSENITFSSSTPIEGINITIFANVTNRANRTESAVMVQFLNGAPGSGSLIGNQTVAIGPLSFETVNMTYLVPVGVSNIYVVIDPPSGSGVIVESNEANNVANHTLFTSMWQIFYGNTTGNVTLDTSANLSFVTWDLGNATGNIFISDTDTTAGISFAFLLPLGRNTTGGRNVNTDNDFEELDTAIGATNLVDSVNDTFTANGDPVLTETFTVYGSELLNVPVVNSSDDGNFTTGILWDSDDSSNGYFDGTDAEDVVFVTSIESGKSGVFGVVDYELRIPANLRSYKPASDTVTFYYELS